VHVDGGPVRWYVRQNGKNGDRSVVFLHGFAGTGADWDGFRNTLPLGWSGIAPDLPGHGESPLPPAISFDKFPAMFGALLDSLGIENVAVVGYSLGARLALSLAGGLPKRIHALFLESAHPGLADPQLVAARRLQDEEDARILEMEGLAAFLERWHQRPVFATRRGGPGWNEEVARKHGTNHPRRLAQVMRGLGLSSQPDFLEALKPSRTRMVLVAGDKDAAYVEHAKRLAAAQPRHRTLILAPCGHNVHTEQPLVFRNALHQFLTTIDQRGA
jgi:2-succinyl-6-hydroxy-2,4-cyclohexadiene-1-carboxylate synthase